MGTGTRIAALALLALSSLPLAAAADEPTAQEAGSHGAIRDGDCIVDSIAALVDCARDAGSHARLNIRRDLECGGDCCPGGGALLRLAGVGPLEIVGNGKRLLRRSDQRACSLIDVSGSRGISVVDWRLDDDAGVAPCAVTDRCPRMVHVRGSSEVRFAGVEVAHSKGYAIYIDGVDGFAFTDSTLRDSGVLGLYVGHEDRASSRVRIARSVFRDNQTNAVALLGVSGGAPGDNLVVDNLFERNHWRGQFPVEPRFGSGFTGGGQLYLARAGGVIVAGNRFRAGRCENCFFQGALGSGVSGIELGLPGRRSLAGVLIRDNEITDQDAFGVFANQGSPVDDRIEVRDNRLIGNGRGASLPGAQLSGNAIVDR